MLSELTPSTDVKVQILYIDPLQQRISLRLEETAVSQEPEEAAESEHEDAEADSTEEAEASEEVAGNNEIAGDDEIAGDEAESEG
jgi:hypothetical protein